MIPVHFPALISIVIPAWREPEIQRQVNRYSSLSNVEVVVALGEGDDITTIPKGAVVARGERGRARQMNNGARSSKGAILIFLHADTDAPTDSFDLIRQTLADSQNSIGCFKLELAPANFWIWLVSRVANIRTKVLGSPYGDQALFLRRDDFEQMGGFRNEPILEDVLLVKEAKKRGRLVILPHYAKSSSRRWYERGMYSTTFRNWAIMVAFALGVSPGRLVKLFKR
jgi:hypothetical protein